MQLPHERGPVSRHVIESLAGGADAAPPEIGTGTVSDDADVMLALWTLYELHYRGFDGVPAEREWDLGLLALRQQIEGRFEQELREATTDLVAGVPADGDIGQQLLALVAADDGPATAAFMHRKASPEQLVDYLRERSVQQLKESDAESFVLPRLDGAAKAALAELQYDEYGGGRPERLHATMYADALEAAGLDRTYGAYIDVVSALSLASTNMVSMFGINRRLRGAAMGHLAAFEASSSVPCRKIAGGLERAGFPAAVTAYFHEHVEADAVHEHVASHDICGVMVAQDPTLREDVLFGAAACLHVDGRAGGELLDRWTAELETAS